MYGCKTPWEEKKTITLPIKLITTVKIQLNPQLILNFIIKFRVTYSEVFD